MTAESAGECSDPCTKIRFRIHKRPINFSIVKFLGHGTGNTSIGCAADCAGDKSSLHRFPAGTADSTEKPYARSSHAIDFYIAPNDFVTGTSKAVNDTACCP